MYKLFDKAKGNRMYLLLIPIIVVIVEYSVLSVGVEEFEWETLQEKRIEVEREVNMLGDYIQFEVTKDIDWGEYDYDTNIAVAMAKIDALPMTFAAVYQFNDGYGYTDLAERTPSYEYSPFDPFAYPEFAEAIAGNTERGEVVVWFETEEVDGREMYVYYRWVPARVDNPYLLAVAISRYTVETPTAGWITKGIIVFGTATGLLDFILVGYIIHIISRRQLNEVT